MVKALVSVAGIDRTGIIAAVSGKLSALNVNILEISQTILDGCFTMMMVVDIQEASADLMGISEALGATGQEMDMEIHIRKVSLFDAMHRV